MKYFSLFVLGFWLIGQANAASLTCINPETSPPTKWAVTANGMVNRGSLVVEQPTTEMEALVLETGKEKKLEFTKLVASPFQGGCVISEKGPLVFECGLHGYGRTYFSPGAMYCHNKDWSRIEINHDEETETIKWNLSYLFGTCYESQKKLSLEGEAKLEAIFKTEQCKFVP